MLWIALKILYIFLLPTLDSLYSSILPLHVQHLRVWQYDCECFSNNFSCQNACQWCFLFFKNYFWHQHIKTIQNIQTIFNFNKKTKIFKIFRNAAAAAAAFPNICVNALGSWQAVHSSSMWVTIFLASQAGDVSACVRETRLTIIVLKISLFLCLCCVLWMEPLKKLEKVRKISFYDWVLCIIGLYCIQP